MVVVAVAVKVVLAMTMEDEGKRTGHDPSCSDALPGAATIIQHFANQRPALAEPSAATRPEA